MFDLIEHLRGKPEKYRKRFSLAVAFFATAVIFAVWASVLFPAGQSRIVARAQPEREVQKADSPIATIRKSTAQAFSAIKGILSDSEKSIDFQSEYERIRDQVDSGQIKLGPQEVRP